MYIYWGWVIVVSFVILYTLSMCVSAATFAELIVPMSAESNADLSLLMFLGSIPNNLPLLIAPVSNWLHYQYGTRPTVFIGVLIVSITLVTMPFIPGISLMLFIYGIVGGMGLMCVLNSPFILVSEYFPYDHPRHVLATSILITSVPLAWLLGNPISYAVMSAVGWRATYFINGLIMFVVGVATCSTFRATTKTELDREMRGTSVPKTPEIDKCNKEEDPDQLNGEICKESLLNTFDESDIKRENIPGMMVSHNSKQSENSLQINNSETNSTDKGELLQLIPQVSVIPKRTKIIIGVIWLIVSTLKSFGYFTPMTTLVKQMESLGIPQDKASYAMLLAGACEVVSRVVTSFVGDRFKGNALFMYVAFSLILCVQNALGSMAYTYVHLLLYATTLGIFAGPIIAAMYSSCAEVLGGEHVPALFSLFRSGIGLGGLAGPAIAGAIYDNTGSFTALFYTTSATYGVTSLLYGLIIVINRVRPSFFYPPQENDVIRERNYSSSRSNTDNYTSGMSDKHRESGGK